MLKFNAVLLTLVLMPMPSWALSYFEDIGWVTPNSQALTQLQYPSLVEDIYRNNDEQLIWFDLQQSSRLEFQLDLIHQANVSPLLSRQLKLLRFYRNSHRWFEYDILATDTMMTYMSYAEQAKHMGKEWYFETKLTQPLPVPTVQALDALHASIASQQLGELIETYTPDSENYQSLIKAYLHLANAHEQELPKYHQETQLKRVGDLLNARTALLDRLEVVDIDLSKVEFNIGYYDGRLESAIKQFQAMHGLKADGVIGPKTIQWLNVANHDRLTMLAVNAERERMWPQQRNTIIVVNVPSFEMEYWYDGESMFQSRVVVGREARKTPVMSTNLDSVILNPTWNVPWKIMVEDIIPHMQEDPNYLSRKNIDIIANWQSDQVIDPLEIDWPSLNPKAFPYRMRQMSGNYNALGLYKFNTPNKRAIFLHDTPSKHLFSKESRAFSSGCVRVKHADAFAALLLENQGVDLEKLAISPDEANKAIPLRKRIPVHIIYQTAWAEGGIVQYRDDIYHFDR